MEEDAVRERLDGDRAAGPGLRRAEGRVRDDRPALPGARRAAREVLLRRRDRDAAVQIDRRGRDLAPGHRRRPAEAGGPHVRRGGHAHERPARVRGRRLGSVPLGRRRIDVAPHGPGRPPHPDGAGGLQLRCVREPLEPRRRLHGEHLRLRVHRRWEHVHGFPGRAGRRRPAADVDRPHRRPAHLPGHGPGRHREPGRRPHVEPVVQPVHRAGLPRLDRQLVAVLGVRPAAGRRRHPGPEPRQLRRDHAPGLEPGGRVGVGHGDRRPARPEDRVQQ